MSDDALPGYHITAIKRGEVGEISKIREELDELDDAAQQGVRIMALVELSDLVGAINCHLARHFPGFTLDDLSAMASVTARAFQSGRRS